MKNSKFIKLLTLLTAHKIASFVHYLRCFYPNEEISLKVMNYLSDTTAQFSNLEGLNFPETFLQKLYTQAQDTKSRHKQLHNTFSDLHRWLKEYIMLERIRKNDWLNDVVWLQVLDENNWSEQYEKKANAFFESTQKAPLKSTQNMLKHWAAAYHQYNQLVKSSALANMKAFDASYHSLNQISTLLKVKMENERTSFLKIAPQLETPLQKPGDLPLFMLYESLLKLNTTEREEDFSILEENMLNLKDHIDLDEMHNVLRFMKNYAIGQFRKGINMKYFQERIHSLNKVGVQNGIFKKSASITPTEFLGILNVACALKDFDWATDFIRDMTIKIKEADREITHQIAQIQLAIAKERYPEALDLINAMVLEGDGNEHQVHVRLAKIRCMYELNYEYEDLDEYIKKYKTHLTLRKSTPKNKSNEGALRTIKIIKMLLDQKKDKATIQQLIESKNDLHLRTWLKKKVADYKKR
ncbi:MAG: hypothetical protein NW218_15440 [Saprospiraceae bacterium]|nr:hypothetical protein [Saprospiraceae bacterium]